jgi:chloramphenicol 3-O phosphotransferase
VVDVVVLNGGSSSGKTTLAVCLQQLLDDAWLRLGVDTLIDACPPSLLGYGGLRLGPAGAVEAGQAFQHVEDAWMRGVAAIARAGVHVIVDDVFLGGALSQQRWRDALGGLQALWVGVRCAPQLAVERESGRADRIAGMAEAQALAVHRGVVYDLEVDTAVLAPEACAERIAAAAALTAR